MGTSAIGGLLTAQTLTASCTVAQVEAVDTVLATMSIPGDATVVEVVLSATDMAASALALDVGDAAGPASPDDARFIAAMAGSAATVERWSDTAAQAPYTYSTTGEQEIEVTVQTAATGGIAGTVTLTVLYFRQ
jgi:hypothetical protein